MKNPTQFRLKIAVNLFKRSVLEDLHVPNKPQSISLFSRLEEIDSYTILTDRTWQSWFTDKVVIPKRGKMRELEKLTDILKIKCDSIYLTYNYEDLVLGGLLKKYLDSKHSDAALDNYFQEKNRKISSLQLFLDAIELSTLKTGLLDYSWEKTTRILGHKILHALYLRWSPRNGYIYNHLPSDLKMEWDEAGADRREKLKKNYERFAVNLFEHAFNSHPNPQQFSSGFFIDEPYQQFYKYLLSLADNPDFLKGYRLKVWALDLATAAFAMHAVAWTERHKTFGVNTTQEGIYWSAFYGLFIDSEFFEEDNSSLELALIDSCGIYNSRQIELLKLAVLVYQNELFELGTSTKEISSYVMQIRHNHPMVFKA